IRSCAMSGGRPISVLHHRDTENILTREIIYPTLCLCASVVEFFSCWRQQDGEFGAAFGSVANPHLAAVSLYDVADDGEAETAAFLRTTQAVVDAVEAFEDTAMLTAGNAGSVVAHRERDVSILARANEMDVLRLTAVLGGILQQV